uniref:Gustatory receptor n=1 Tax=Phlebotomus papatasi TaxID=29031 RepID=A0A3F2ZEL0_PHLPP
MSLEQRFGLQLAIQKWITIPNYPLCVTKHSKFIVFLKYFLIFLLNFTVFRDIQNLLSQLSLNFFEDRSKLSLTLSILDSFLVKSIILIITTFSIVKNKSHRKLLECMDKFNNEFCQHFQEHKNHSFCKKFNILPIMVLIYNASCNIFYFYLIPFGSNLLDYIWVLTTIIHLTISDITLCYILNFLDIFQIYLTLLKKDIVGSFIKKSLIICDIWQKHRDLSKQFNSTFSFLITYYLFHHFMEGSFAIYFGINKIVHPTTNYSKIIPLLSFVGWFSRSAFLLFAISSSCDNFYQKNIAYIESINRTMVYKSLNNFNAYQTIKINAFQIPKISAMNIFYIDAKTFFMIFASITSNLFILLQFKIIEDS